MKRISLHIALLSCFGVLAFAQAPTINTDGVVSAASNLPTAFPGGGIAQGSLFLIYGANLGPASLMQANSYPLPTSLGNTSIQITSGGTNTAAIMVYSIATQVAAILPSSVPVGNATLTLTNNGQTSASVPIKVIKSSFASFTLNQGGTGPGIVTDASAPKNADGSDLVNTLFTSAMPGDVMVLWGTGLGPVSDLANEAMKPLPGDLGLNPTVYVGGKQAAVSYAGRSGCCSGLDQIAFTVPQGVTGCYVPVVVVVSGVTSTFPTMSISTTDRHTCTDPVGLPAALLSKYQAGQDVRVGSILLNRINPTLAAGGLSFGLKQDSAAASFYKFNSSSATGSLISQRSLSSLPSPGGCQVYFCRSSLCTPANDPVRSDYLDAGNSLAITNGTTNSNANQIIKETAKGRYFEALGGGIPLLPGFTPYYLEPGNKVTVSGMGGADVGGFGVNATIPTELNWTNSSSITTVDRTKDLTVTWSGATGEFVTVNGSSTSTGDLSTQVTATFECTAPASAGTFTVPSYILQSMPASGTISQGGFTVPAGFILLSNFSPGGTFSTSGLDIGVLTTLDAGGKQAIFQ